MRLIVADDHRLVRDSLSGFIQGHNPEWRVNAVGTLNDFHASVAAHGCDLVLLDLNMPGMNGRSTLCDLRSTYPDLRILILTGTDDRNVILDCLSSGVHGYMVKTESAEALMSAVHLVLHGGICVPNSLSRLSAASQAPCTDQTPQTKLTGRQQEVLALVAEGLSTKGIARRLSLGLGTVKVHIAGVYKALGAHSRVEAVAKSAKVLGT